MKTKIGITDVIYYTSRDCVSKAKNAISKKFEANRKTDKSLSVREKALKEEIKTIEKLVNEASASGKLYIVYNFDKGVFANDLRVDEARKIAKYFKSKGYSIMIDYYVQSQYVPSMCIKWNNIVRSIGFNRHFFK